MMVQKARLFGDEDVARRMLGTVDPKEHRALGRKVAGFRERVWDECRVFSFFLSFLLCCSFGGRAI